MRRAATCKTRTACFASRCFGLIPALLEEALDPRPLAMAPSNSKTIPLFSAASALPIPTGRVACCVPITSLRPAHAYLSGSPGKSTHLVTAPDLPYAQPLLAFAARTGVFWLVSHFCCAEMEHFSRNVSWRAS